MRFALVSTQRNPAAVIREMREAAGEADDAGDPGTADVFTRFVQIHEKHEWYLRDLLERGDGLVS